MFNHQIEKELLQATPRHLRRKSTTANRMGMGFLRIFLLPFIAGGIGTLLTALLATSVIFFRQNASETIVHHHTKYDSEDGTTYYLDYNFAMDGATHSATQKVSSVEYRHWPDGTTMGARALSIMPSRSAQLQLPGVMPSRGALMWWGFTLFWNTVVSLFVWAAFVQPVVARHLVAKGTPTFVRISDKKNARGDDSDSYLLHYEYAPIEYSINDTQLQADAFAPQNINSLQNRQKPLVGKMTVLHSDYQ